MRFIYCGMLLGWIYGSGLSAQERPLEQGQLVRVTSGDSRVVGQLGTSTSDSLVVLIGGNASNRAVFPLTSISRLEVHHQNSPLDGARRGARIGGALGLLSGFFSDTPTGGEGQTMSRWVVVPLATASTAALGAAVGAAFPGSRWRQVSLPDPRASGIYSARSTPYPRPELAEVINPAARALDLPPLSEVELSPSAREVRVWIGFGVAIPHDFVRIVQVRRAVMGELGRFWEEQSLGPPDDRLWADELRKELERLGCRPIRVANEIGACLNRSIRPLDWKLLLEQLDSLGVSDLPDQSQLPGEGGMILDGWMMVIEMLDERTYRSYSYSNPDVGMRPEERSAAAIGQVLRNFISNAYAPESRR